MATENPTWGAPRVHGELRMLGFEVSERVRRELLDHVVVFNDRHLLRLLRDYVTYHHDDRTYLGLAKATPAGRPRQTRPVGDAQVIALPRLGGLHHRYEWRAAA